MEELDNMMPWERDIYLGLTMKQLREEQKRNEEEQKRDKRISYISTGIITLLVIAVMLLIYYFS